MYTSRFMTHDSHEHEPRGSRQTWDSLRALKTCFRLSHIISELLCRSKSLGNFFSIRDIVQAYHPMALRWWLVGTQYRQPVNYTERSLQEASDRVYYVFETIVTTEAALHDAGVSSFFFTCFRRLHTLMLFLPCLGSHAHDSKGSLFK
jgi:cysteinyl-tRNA synthetase